MAHTELRPQKRQRVVSPGSASGDEAPPVDPSEDCSDQERGNIEELSKTFGRFEGVLCELLSAASVVDDAKEALGEHKGGFVIALKRMVEAGDLPWVYQIDSGVEGSGGEVEAGESEIASSSQMDIDEMEIVSTNQPGGEEVGVGVVSASQVKTKEGGVSPASQAEIGEAEVGEGEIASANEMEIDEIEIVSVSQIRPRVEAKNNTLNHENVSLKEPLSIPTPTRNSQGIWPPPLPYIQNEALRRQALTPDTAQNSHDPAAHYQRLEWLGDAYMEVLVSRILFDRFPTAREGPLTRMRQPLLTNKLFSNFGTMYDFGAMIGEYSAQREAAPSLKVLADCFEAYVAAIALSDPDKGLDTLMQWLLPLYEPMFSEVGNGSQFKDEYSYGSKMEFLVPSRALMRRGGFKKINPPKIVSQAPKQGKGRRRQSHKAAHRSSLPPPGSRKIGRRLIQYETGPPIIIEDSGDEDEENWEEVEIAGKENQNSAGIPIDMAAKEKLYALVAGDNVSVKYVCVGDPDSSDSPGGVDAMQGIENGQNEWKVMVNFTGWGCVNRPIGCGWGANEAEAGIRAAMNIMRDRPFCKELDLRKFNKSRQVASPKKQKAPTAPAAPVAPTALMTSTIPGMWKEIDGVVVIDDD